MKTQAIQKINKMGKISSIVTLICKIIISIGLVTCLIAAIMGFVIPENAVKITTTGNLVMEVDYAAMGSTVSEDERKMYEEMEGDVRVTTVGNDLVNGRLEMSGQEYIPTNVSITDTKITVDMETEGNSIGVRASGVMSLLAAVALTMTLITLCFIGSLCKAFRDCESPFEENVIKKMQRLGISLIPWTVISSLTSSLVTSIMTGKVELLLRTDMGVVLVVLIVLILVYTFKYGVVLQQESDETL